MSDDQNKSAGGNSNRKAGKGGVKLPGPLPGLGGSKKGGGPLPGLGGGAPGVLPGLGSKSKAVVPPFMQQAEPEKPEAPSLEQIARDPFGDGALPAQRTSFIPADQGLLGGGGDAGAAFSEAEAGKSKKPLLLGGFLIAAVCIGLGFMGGKAISARAALNTSIRDALIIEYELKKAVKLFNETQGMIGAAFQDTVKKKFNSDHIPFLTASIKRNPISPRVFTERNYKNFDAAAVQWLTDYYNKWTKLYSLVEEHRRETKNDEQVLKAAGKEFIKLLQANYGAVFTRDKTKGFMADLVLIGVCEEKKGKNMCQVQVDTGTFGDARELYTAGPGDKKLTTEPDNYVVPMGDNSKAGMLKNATQSHFNKYQARLRAISDHMKAMAEIQKNLMGQISKVCSLEPVTFLGGIDAVAAFDEYVVNDKNRSNDLPEAP